MKVRDIMTRPAQACPKTMPLPVASRRMRDFGCGTLIVLDAHGRLAGIVTDRDLALAIGDLDVAHATVDRIMTRRVHVCHPDDDIAAALATMRNHKVKRLPVVAPDGDVGDVGDVAGLISIDDIILWGTRDGIASDVVIAALRCICSAKSARLCAELDA